MSGSEPGTDCVERISYCPDCRKPLKLSDGSERKWQCDKCGFERNATAALAYETNEGVIEMGVLTSGDPEASKTSPNEGEDDLEFVTHDLRLDAAKSDQPHSEMANEVNDDEPTDGGLRLQPILAQQSAQHESLQPIGSESINELAAIGIASDSMERSSASASEVRYKESDEASDLRIRRAQENYNHSGGVYPLERHYPTLEAMQRLYRLFSYAAVLIVFPYLLARLGYVFWTTQDGLLRELGSYLEFAVPVIFGTVAFVGTLFALSEGIRLAIDIQENTLRLANRQGRRKP